MRLFLICILLSLTACTPASGSLEQQGSSVQTPRPVSTSTMALVTSPSPLPETTSTQAAPAPSATSEPSPTASPAALTICSPLEGITLAELSQPDLLKNPFQPPRPGMDDGHHGADFAYWSRGERKTMLGLPVLSVLPGRIAGIIRGRQPYGNAILIETPLDNLSPATFTSMGIPTLSPTVQPASNLFCPASPENRYNSPHRSLYLLYAHLNLPPPGSIGDQVTCGQPIGEVGTTGKSVNPHLHLETRVGPSAAVFPAMAHYENDASNAEMSAYCAWRVSGLFQMFDPLSLLESGGSLQP